VTTLLNGGQGVIPALARFHGDVDAVFTSMAF